MEKETTRFRAWFNNLPIKDLIQYRMGLLLQGLLLGFIALLLLTVIANLFLAPPSMSRLETVIRGIIITSIFNIPIFLLRRGHFHGAAILLIVLFLVQMTAGVLTTNLQSATDTLSFFTLIIILAGLLVSRKALIATYIFCVGLLLFATLQEQDLALRYEDTIILGNFILINGLISIFISSFGVTLRNSLQSALQREEDLKIEIKTRKRIEGNLKNALEREQRLNEVTSTISSKLDLDTILSIVVQLTAELVDANSGAMSLVSADGQSISHHNLFNLPEELELDKAVPKGHGLSWRVIETRQSVLIEDYKKYEESLSNWESTNLHSLIEVPLTVGDSCLGTLSVAKLDPSLHFSDRDLALVESVGRQTAIAIQNARLFEAQQHELNERIRIEKEREELIVKLEERNDELTRFTYTVSHDLRNPLVTIRGFLGMLNKDLEENRHDRIQSDFERIANATDKMDALLTDLLELSRVGRIVNPPIEIDAVRLIQDAIDSVVDARFGSRRVAVNIATELPPLYGDQTRLREVFENLIDNAIKYMGQQSDPIVEIGMRDQTFYVKDNGMGVEERYHSKIFGLFEKLNPTIEGTGIGLALVKRIIETHGGIIWVESEGLGKGSTFCFTIPTNRI